MLAHTQNTLTQLSNQFHALYLGLYSCSAGNSPLYPLVSDSYM